jgi:hypothetical protein
MQPTIAAFHPEYVFVRDGILLVGLVLGLVTSALAQEERPGTHEQPSASSASVPMEVQQRLVALLPDKSKWKTGVAVEPVCYGANLYEYINGGAEVFHLYDFVALIHQEYQAKKVKVTVDIYDMGQPINAFGIYASERSTDYDFLPIGAEGYVSDQTLNFLQGPYYVKLSAFSQNGQARSTLEAFAASISKQIQWGKALPDVFNRFPTADRLPRSEKFIRTSPLGHEFLAPAYQVSYLLSGIESTLVLSEATTPAQTLQRVLQMEERFRKSGKVIPLPELGDDAFRGTNSYEGATLFLPHGIYTVLLVNPPPDGVAFLKKALQEIPKNR